MGTDSGRARQAVGGEGYPRDRRVVGTESGRAIQPAPVLQLLLEALQVENEENGNLCQRVCFDVHRPARTNLEELSLPYCDFAAQVPSFTCCNVLSLRVLRF